MINLFCALPCEAKPIINQYRLRLYSKTSLFDTYVDENQSVSMTITGPGKQSASGAVVHTYMLLQGSKFDAWLNIGIAGHSVLPIGTPLLANKVIEKSTDRSWYPQIIFKTDLLSETIFTLDKPSTEYPEQGAIDMEASAFCESASRIGLMELIHSLKFISDSRQYHHNKVSRKSVSHIIDTNLETINNVITDLKKLTQIVYKTDPLHETYNEIIANWHVTHSHRLQLKKALRRWNTLLPNEKLNMDMLQQYTSSKQIINHLNSMLDNQEIHF